MSDNLPETINQSFFFDTKFGKETWVVFFTGRISKYIDWTNRTLVQLGSRKEKNGLNIASSCDISFLPCIMNGFYLCFGTRKSNSWNMKLFIAGSLGILNFIYFVFIWKMWINALKYSFIEILNVLFNSKFCREENILTPASSPGSVKNYLANITQIYYEEENCFHTPQSSVLTNPARPVTPTSKFPPPGRKHQIQFSL